MVDLHVEFGLRTPPRVRRSLECPSAPRVELTSPVRICPLASFLSPSRSSPPPILTVHPPPLSLRKRAFVNHDKEGKKNKRQRTAAVQVYPELHHVDGIVPSLFENVNSNGNELYGSFFTDYPSTTSTKFSQSKECLVPSTPSVRYPTFDLFDHLRSVNENHDECTKSEFSQSLKSRVHDESKPSGKSSLKRKHVSSTVLVPDERAAREQENVRTSPATVSPVLLTCFMHKFDALVKSRSTTSY